MIKYKFYVKPIFAWYDLWVGLFIDNKQQRIYIFPIPMIGLMISWIRK